MLKNEVVSPRVVPVARGRRFSALLLVAALSTGSAACSGALFSSQRTPSDAAPAHRPTATAAEMLAFDVSELDGSARAGELTRSLAVAGRHGTEEERAALRRHRAGVVADTLVAAAALDAVDPERAAYLRDAAATLIGTPATDAAFTRAAVERVRADAAGVPDAAALVAAVRAGVGSEPVDALAGPHGALLRIAKLWPGLAAWLRSGARAESAEFARRVVATYPVSVPPESVELLGDSHEALVAAQTLLGLNAACEAARATAETPVGQAARPSTEAFCDSVAAAGVPIAPTPPLPPVIVPPRSASGGLPSGAMFMRRLFVSTTDVRVAVAPLVMVEDGSLARPPGVESWPPEGERVIAFERWSSPGPGDLVDGTAPPLAAALSSLEEGLLTADWIAPDESRAHRTTVGFSVVADGDVYFATLAPVLATLLDAGYAPLALHVGDRADRVLPVRIRRDDVAGSDRLSIRADGFVVQPFDPDNLVEPESILFSDAEPLSRLHSAIANLAPERPLVVVVDDNTSDYGLVANTLAAISFARAAEVETDAALLNTDLAMDARGAPTPLRPAGVWLWLGE